MKTITRHLSRCFIAGIVAMMPIAGVVLTVAFMEKQLAGSWLSKQGFYFYGLGLIAAVVLIYAVGLVVSTFLGRWLWGRVDALLGRLPLIGRIYQTLKQVLGYGEGPDAVFRRAVLLRCRDLPGHEIGLVTDEPPAPAPITVFVPGDPIRLYGRILLIDRDATQPLDCSVSDALKCLVSIGALPLESIPRTDSPE